MRARSWRYSHVEASAPAARASMLWAGFGTVRSPRPIWTRTLRWRRSGAKAIGSPCIVCAPTHEDLKDIEKLAKESKIKIAIHNHGPEDKFMPTP